MRNLLAFVAAALLAFAGVGWYLDWYKVKSDPAPNGHRRVNIDINSDKILEDVHKGVQKGEEKIQDAVEKDKKPSTEASKATDKTVTPEAPKVPAGQ